MGYDVIMIPGHATKNTNNLRLWERKPKRGFDLQSFNGARRCFLGGQDGQGTLTRGCSW